MSAPLLKDRVCLITGASRGLGAALARRLAREGAHLILVARTVGALEELDDDVRNAGGSATLVPLDLMDLPAIDRLAAPLYERFGHLDGLIGNAAMLGRLTPLPQYPPELWEQIFKLNVHANWRLIRALDPLLRAAPAGRAVFITSGITRRLSGYWGGYAATKAALEAMITTYAKETRQTNLRINLVNPGPMRTDMRRAAFPGETENDVPSPEEIAENILPLMMPNCTLHGAWIAADETKQAKTEIH